jgi:hypothetical protein
MDNLLGGLFFKCYDCKVLTKVNYRETISSEQEIVNNIFHQGNDINNDVRMLFQKDAEIDESLPIRSLFQNNFSGNRGGNNQSINSNIRGDSKFKNIIINIF